jgi:hypothetical protein
MTTSEMIISLRASFGKIERMDPNGSIYRGACSLLDRCDDDALKAVYKAKIKFVSSLALNRMIRRGIAA